HDLGESGVMVSSMGARALPPPYHTATGKNVGWRTSACLISRCDDSGAFHAPEPASPTLVDAGMSSASARITTRANSSRTIRLPFFDSQVPFAPNKGLIQSGKLIVRSRM